MLSAKRKHRKSAGKHKIVFFCTLFLIFAGMVLLFVEIHRTMQSSINMKELDAHIRRAAAEYQLDPELVKALIWRESHFNPRAVGKSGEIGLMQLVPAGSPGAVSEWSRLTGNPPPSRRELFDVDTNLNIGCWYLASALKKYSSYRYCTELALAEYNAGASRVNRWKPETPDGEVLDRINIGSTRNYVTHIMRRYRESQEKK